MDFVSQLIQGYITDPKFLMDAGITFVVLDALQEIKWVDDLGKQYKKIAALVIGGLLAPFVIEASVMGVVAGVFAGASLTMVMERVKILTNEAGTKAAEPEDTSDQKS